jgi:predicted transcriptional regulator
MKLTEQERLRRKGLRLQIEALKLGLTGREIARDLGCHEDLVWKAYKGKRRAAQERVREYLERVRSGAS